MTSKVKKCTLLSLIVALCLSFTVAAISFVQTTTVSAQDGSPLAKVGTTEYATID